MRQIEEQIQFYENDLAHCERKIRTCYLEDKAKWTHRIRSAKDILRSLNSHANLLITYDYVVPAGAEDGLLVMLERLLDEVMISEEVFSRLSALTLEQARNAVDKARGE